MATDCRDPLNLPYFSPTRPATFDGGLKYYEQLLALKCRIDALCEAFQAADIPGINAQIEKLWEYVTSDAFEGPIAEWVMCNLPCIVAQVCKWFHFGINDNGNVVCTIPLSWQDFNISWNMDFDSPDFGRLTIGW